ncbi:MAG: adenosylcobinamide amidohydrolase [Methanosarcinaceae archaeon]|nr:adenosylcobinamide amidohydrolase [Methanosarcinaceae archaeon]
MTSTFTIKNLSFLGSGSGSSQVSDSDSGSDSDLKNFIDFIDFIDFIKIEIRNETLLLIKFKKPVITLGNSVLNGGFNESKTLFNLSIPKTTDPERDFPEGSTFLFIKNICENESIDISDATGLITAASVKNSAISYIKYGGGNKGSGNNDYGSFSVTCIATAGVDVNGGRAGDPASYYENSGKFVQFGTINIFLIIEATLTEYAMVKSIITATEAKTTVLQELLAPSKYSDGLATGSGTDGIIVASFKEKSGKTKLTDAGHHSKLGEMISKTVREALRYALFSETGLSPEKQKNIWARLSRFNVLPEFVYDDATQSLLTELEYDGSFTAFIESAVHLKDQVSWGLLKESDAIKNILPYGCSGCFKIPREYYSIITFDDDFSKNMIEFLRKVHSVKI